MLWAIAVILLVLWLLGMVNSYTAGGLVHLLLVIAVVVICVPVHRWPSIHLTAPQSPVHVTCGAGVKSVKNDMRIEYGQASNSEALSIA